MGGRDTYTSTTDIISTIGSTVIPDTNVYSVDGRRGRASVIAKTKEVLSGDCEMGGMKVSHLFVRFIGADFPPG